MARHAADTSDGPHARRQLRERVSADDQIRCRPLAHAGDVRDALREIDAAILEQCRAEACADIEQGATAIDLRCRDERRTGSKGGPCRGAGTRAEIQQASDAIEHVRRHLREHGAHRGVRRRHPHGEIGGVRRRVGDGGRPSVRICLGERRHGGAERTRRQPRELPINRRLQRIGKVDGQGRGASRRNATPASACVGRPSSIAKVPLTSTQCMPDA